MMFEQNVHSATTEITPEGLAKFAEKNSPTRKWNGVVE